MSYFSVEFLNCFFFRSYAFSSYALYENCDNNQTILYCRNAYPVPVLLAMILREYVVYCIYAFLKDKKYQRNCIVFQMHLDLKRTGGLKGF